MNQAAVKSRSATKEPNPKKRKGFNMANRLVWVREQRDLNSAEKAVLFVMCSRTQENDWFEVRVTGLTQREWASEAGMSERTFQRTIKSLQDKGIIEFKRRMSRGNAYSLFPSEDFMQRQENKGLKVIEGGKGKKPKDKIARQKAALDKKDEAEFQAWEERFKQGELTAPGA